MKKIYVFLLSLFCLLSLAIPMHGETVTDSWTFSNSSVSGWVCTPQSSYCGGYYSGGKSSAFTVTNANIPKIAAVNFENVSNPSIQITVKGITNNGTNKFSVDLIDNKGNVLVQGTSVSSKLTNATNVNDATGGGTTTLVPIAGVTGYIIRCEAKTVLAGTSYVLTYTDAPAAKHTLTYYEGNTSTDIEVVKGANILETLKDINPTSCDATSTTFIGWTTTSINGKQSTCPQLIAKDATITSDMTVYAVFAKAEGGGSSGAAAGTVLWAENFAHFGTNTPSTAGAGSGTTIYGNASVYYAQSSTATKAYNESLAGGTAPELLLAKSNTTWTISGIPTAGATEMRLTLLSNKTTGITLSSSTAGITCNDTYGNWSILNGNGAETFTLELKNTTSGNIRIDNLNLTVTKGGSSTTYTDYVTSCGECQDLEPWSGLAARDVAWNTATLAWDKPANVSGYKVTVTDKNAPADYNKTFTIDNANTTTLNLDGLTRGTEYQWTITAIPADGYCTTTSDPQTFTTKECTQLPAPTNLKVTYDEESGRYTFSWDKVEGATEYRMNGGFSGTIKGTSSTQALTRNPGEEYTQLVTAIGDNGQWCDSEPASITYKGHVFTLTLSVTDNGTTTTTEIKQPKYTLPTATSMCEDRDGYSFAGWSETVLADETTTTPTLIAAGTEYAPDNGFIKSDKTLYAVFSKMDEETVSDAYEKVTTEDDVTNGNYMIVGLGASSTYYALTSTPATTSGWFKGSSLGKSLALSYSTTDPTQIWEIKKEGTNYLIYNAAKKQYLNINSSKLVMEDAGIPYTLSVAYAGNVSFKSTKNTSYYLASHAGQAGIFNAYTQANTVYLYKNATIYIYTTSPSCIDCNDPNNNCPEYPVVLNDRGTETEAGTYWVGEEIPEPKYKPQGGCEGYEFAGWTTEEGLSNLTAEEWKSKMVTFPCKMPAKAAAEGKLTLYAVYSSELTDEYQLVTDMTALSTGEYVEYVITATTAEGAGAKENALSFVRADYIENFGSQEVDITTNEAGNDIVSTTNPEIIWTLTATDEGGYTLEALHFEGMEKKSYLNIVSNYLQFEETAKPYTIEQGTDNNTFTLCSGGGSAAAYAPSIHRLSTAYPPLIRRSSAAYQTSGETEEDGYCLSYNGKDFVAGAATPLHLYKRVKETRYSTSTACDPSIISVGTVAVTSAPGIWVEAVTQPYIFAERLWSNRDGAASVDIIATSKTAQFTLKPVGATGAGSESLTLKEGETRDNFADRFMVVYKPTGYDVIDEGEIVVKAVNAADHSKEYAVHTIRVKGRSLPNQFVIAAQTDNGWVALPADLGTSSLAVLKAPYRIEVDDEADPTQAILAPQTALYHAAGRFDDNTNPRGVHLMNGNGMRLCGDYSKEPDNRLWFANGEVKNSQSWALRSLALKDYYIRLQAAPAGNYLFYNATTGGGKIGYYEYKQQNRLRLRLLPVGATCVRYDAPVVQVAQLQSESVTLEWQDVQSGVGYEYTLDGGDTWTTFGTEHGWEVKNGVNTATISGLTPEEDYTVSVRAAVEEGQNCSEEGTRTFTMPLCDDVPHHLWATATADSVTIVWEAKAATATVRLYSDEAGTHTVAEDAGAESPHSIKGLTQNTKYWYQVLADGTCASAIASFTTESNDISIVEWEKEAVIVDINTEVADGVSVVVEKRVEHGAGNQNIAEDLFFSKYYEASGTTKLLGIYNGTKEDIDLTNITIHTGIDTWNQTIILTGRVPGDIIKPNQEIIFWTKGASNLYSCVEEKIDTKDFVECVARDGLGGALNFSGRQSIALVRDGKIIDLIGAITASGTTISGTSPKEGTCHPSWGDIHENNATNYARCGWGYSIEDKTTQIELSTNRCLLVRSSSVKSGKNAAEKNIGNFVTLGEGQQTGAVTADCEWLGRQVENNSTDKGVQSSCDGFAYVADFDYNDYYTTFEGMDTVKIDGQKNPNGTYTIPVKRLDTLACNDIRLQLTKNGEVTASVEQKVPIIVDKTTDTKDATYFPESLTDEICSTCDVVVRGEQKLTHNIGARKFRNMYIYHGSRLEIDPAAAIQLEKLRMFALNDDVSYAIVNNSAKEGEGSTPSIYVKEISHVKRIDGQYWYPFSLPYNCYIKDISALNGRELGEYSMDWGIKYYDGQKRQAAGKSAAAGQTSDFWYMMPADGMLEAYKGYIIGLFTGDEKHQKSINFAPANINTYTETDESKTTYVENWTDNLEAAARHHGWNFTGSPYISLFGSDVAGEGLYNANLQMGRTNPKTGDQEETEWVYVSIPNGGNSRTYTQQLASATQVKPFSAYFVQAIDPAEGASEGESISLTYSKANRSLTEQAANPTLAPRRASSRDEVLFAELVLRASAHSASGMSDNAGVLVSNRFSTEYEIGYDLTKMYAAADKPQLYTLASDNEKMAYNAVPDLWGQHVPLGIYVPSAGDYTLSLNPSASRLEHAESVLLLYNGGIAANLLTGDYTLSAAGKGSVSGYSLDIRRSREIATDTEASAVGMTGVGVQNGELVLLNLPGDADVAVYDMLGRVLLSTRTTGDTPQISVPDLPTGIYTAVVTTAENQQIFKTMLR